MSLMFEQVNGLALFSMRLLTSAGQSECRFGFYATKSTTGEVLFQLLNDVIKKLNLDLKNIVGLAFDGAASVNGIPHDLSMRMKKCSL